MSWPDEWENLLSGEACGLCAEGRPDDKKGSPRFFVGRWSDAYLMGRGIQRGWATIIWRGRHVVEPTDLTTDEWAGFSGEVLTVARAMQAHYRPIKMNYSIMGNRNPHVHAILTPRFVDDIAPGWPIPAERGDPFPEDEIAADAATLRSLLGQ